VPMDDKSIGICITGWHGIFFLVLFNFLVKYWKEWQGIFYWSP
jgi:hypothetical protein